MQKSLTLFSMLAILIISNSIAQEPPKTGAVLRTSASEVSLTKGQTTEIELTLVRSKADRKTDFDVPQVQEIEGIHASVKPMETPDRYLVALTPTTALGEYLLIIRGAGVNKRYVTSAMIKLMVAEEGTLVLED